MEIQPTRSALPTTLLDALKRNAAARGSSDVGSPAQAKQVESFSGALDSAMRAVSSSQAEANRLTEAFLRDPAGTSLESAMVATQKSTIAFQSALHVRNKLVSAYSDIMNMQV